MRTITTLSLLLLLHQTLSTPTRKHALISGKRMSYLESGTGSPIVLVHGDVVSSFTWRTIIPHLAHRGRIIAPDLIGFGHSDKLDNTDENSYTLVEHSNYLFQLLEHLHVKRNVTLIAHDWGVALAFLWAYRNRFNPEAVNALVFFEGVVAPLPSMSELPQFAREFFTLVRSPAGEKLVLRDNFMIESFLPDGVVRNLTKREMRVYRKPFLKAGEDRRPLLTFPRQFPIDGEPRDVTRIVVEYEKWLREAAVRKLYFDVVPGAISAFATPVVRRWKTVDIRTIEGLHFVQEDRGDEIGRAINDWL